LSFLWLILTPCSGPEPSAGHGEARGVTSLRVSARKSAEAVLRDLADV
jgi:hypothetical protein